MTDTTTYRINALELGPMANFIYVIEDRRTRRAAVVDPAWDVEAILEYARRHELVISDILLTHSHHDHINGIEGVLRQHDAQLHLLKAEAQFWGQHLDLPTLHHGGDHILLGDTAISVLHTPGHTPGSACYRLGEDLITGDTMFVYGCGRCDLRGGDPEAMFTTLRRLTTELPASTTIHPGHNYSVQPTNSLAGEVEGNPFLHFDDPAQFVEYRMHTHDRCRHEPYDAVPRTGHH
ncbi:MAG: MBL fold metallo-hydrolase [Gammaproteobacteria bacterium SG8_47]|nr:MAG: MBL fold metallo-hydrolase [Gammaproteobacteria bacterium SG8_47]